MGGRKKKVLCDKSSMYFFHDTMQNQTMKLIYHQKRREQSTPILAQ